MKQKNIRAILRNKYYNIKYRFVYSVVWNVSTFATLFGWSIRALLGKLMFIDCKPIESNGGFKYLMIYLSRKPVSKTRMP